MIKKIKKYLTSYQPREIPSAPNVRAAVMHLLFEKDGDVFSILTKRTQTVRHHKGEVSFPGGMFEENDNDLEFTALREAQEEIGVDPGHVEIIGRLDDSWTYSGFVITPYVGIIPHPYDFALSPHEVQYLIFLPYTHLRRDEFSPANRAGEWISFHYNGDRIWGATCRVLMHFRDIIEHEKI
ncbi:MAG: NUDIX hydrolase [Syntrophorhabdaceae bacterium]